MLKREDNGWEREQHSVSKTVNYGLFHPQKKIVLVVVSHQELNIDRATLNGKALLSL